jgi:hypothetical protein
MKRFHISIAVNDFKVALADYSQRLGCASYAVVEGRYAQWRTDLLNFTISCKEGQSAGVIHHIGFEDENESGFREETDANGIVWEYFSHEKQMEEVRQKFHDLRLEN